MYFWVCVPVCFLPVALLDAPLLCFWPLRPPTWLQYQTCYQDTLESVLAVARFQLRLTSRHTHTQVC